MAIGRWGDRMLTEGREGGAMRARMCLARWRGIARLPLPTPSRWEGIQNCFFLLLWLVFENQIGDTDFPGCI
jgi:hypothetical protein